jgi:hypothetical protein
MRNLIIGLVAIVALLAGASGTVRAGEADVVDVEVYKAGDDIYTFDVTIRSNDSNDAYADLFEIVGPDGEVLGTRPLLHAHVSEQPFTRSLSGVRIPASIDRVTVRAHHGRTGYDGATMEIELPR